MSGCLGCVTRESFQGEEEKALNGEIYNPNSPALNALRQRTQLKCAEFNITNGEDAEARAILTCIMPSIAKTATILPPVHCSLGRHVQLGESVFINFNCTFQDEGGIQFGRNVLIGPNCCFYTVDLPTNFETRSAERRTAKPIVIEDDVWLGGSVVVCPGVHIGRGCTVGAGAVVTEDIPAFCIAFGNPCRIHKRIEKPILPE